MRKGTTDWVLAGAIALLAFACRAAEWIGSPEGSETAKGAAYARTRLDVRNAAIRRATLRVASPCFCEPWLDGAKIDPLRVLSPAVTDFGLHVNEDVYDVTGRLSPGRHCLGLWLAPGYSSDYSKHGFRWVKPKCVRAELTVEYADGTSQAWGTDGSWQYREDTPVAYASVYHGEDFDARREVVGWCRADGGDSGWSQALEAASFPSTVEESVIPPIRLTDPRRPLSIRRLPDGAFVVDFGVNRAGVVELRACGERGRVIRIRTAEELKADGTLDTRTNRDARSADVWTLAGTGAAETYRPRFTYHGFRYAEISNYPSDLAEEDVVGWAVRSDLTPIGSFWCSDPDLVWLAEAARRSLESNLLAFPSDCCQRDERTPCLGDVQGSMDVASKFFDMKGFYGAYVGNIPPERTVVIPDPKNYEPGAWIPQRINPDWNGCVITLPWTLWTEYGDREALARHYPAMKRMADIFLRQYPDFVCTHGYGDWNAPNDNNPKHYFSHVTFVNSAWLVHDIDILAKAAAVLDRTEDAALYARRHAEGVAAFNARFLDAKTGVYGSGSQVEYLLPFAWGLVPDASRAAVRANFLRALRERDGESIDFGGYVGTRHFGEVLCDLGEIDLALHMLMRPEYPSFGFMKRNGATALWEQWAYAGSMHSHNHMFLAGVTTFLYTRLAGIRPAQPGYREVAFTPTVPRSLDYVRASLDTPHGRVSSAWRYHGGVVDFAVRVPPGVAATFWGKPLKEGSSEFTLSYDDARRMAGSQSEANNQGESAK